MSAVILISQHQISNKMGWFDNDNSDSEEERRKRKKRPLEETFHTFDQSDDLILLL